MWIPTRIGLCLLTVATTLLSGWQTLPVCACESAAPGKAPACCCANRTMAPDAPCSCCQTHKSAPSESERCGCQAAPADKTPAVPPTPPAAFDDATAAAYPIEGVDPFQALADRKGYTDLGRPPASIPDLVISLSRLTC
jgi:hypothetical protein